MSARPARLPNRPARLFLAITGFVAGTALAAGSAGTAFAASSTAIPATAAPAAVTTTNASDIGLFGVQDPTYDGVYRQSLALIALVSTGHTPDAKAVSWLLSQQCADGAFTAYRADPSVACTAGQEDENATALAIQALVVLGKPAANAVAALKHFQLSDGGFYDNTAFGAPASDANSTGLALSALAAAGIDPASVTSSGKSGDDYLRSVQLDCSATTGAGAYDYQPEATLAANDYATVQAALGQLGKALPVAPGSVATSVPACAAATGAAGSASNAIGYLAARLTATGGALPSAFGSGTDWTTTANAVLDLVAAGQGSAAVTAGAGALSTNAKAYSQSAGADAPGPLATMLLVAHATSADPASFGGLDLPSALAGTERLTVALPSPSPVATPSTGTGTGTGAGPTLPMTGSNAVAPLCTLGAALLALGGIALTVSRRRASESA